MIGQLTSLMLGTGFGIILGWVTTAIQNAGHYARHGNTVAEIQARIEREDRHLRVVEAGRRCS